LVNQGSDIKKHFPEKADQARKHTAVQSHIILKQGFLKRKNAVPRFIYLKLIKLRHITLFN